MTIDQAITELHVAAEEQRLNLAGQSDCGPNQKRLNAILAGISAIVALKNQENDMWKRGLEAHRRANAGILAKEQLTAAGKFKNPWEL
jgi:hypothetical protein